MRPIVLLLACALLAACGSDDDSELSVEEYRKRANEACAEVQEKVEEVDLPSSPDELAGYLERILDLSRPYDRRLRELDPPDQLAPAHREASRLSVRFEREFEEVIEQVRRAENPLTTFRRELDDLLPEIRRSEELSRRLGLDECLESGTFGEPAPGPS